MKIMKSSGEQTTEPAHANEKEEIMYIVCSDLEGVFTPEVWIKLSEKTGIKELGVTTRDIPDYDVLMKKRLTILKENGVKIEDITAVAAAMFPLEGAFEFLEWLKPRTQIIIVSDTYAEFAKPLMKKLGWPTLLCNTLTVGPDVVIETESSTTTIGNEGTGFVNNGLIRVNNGLTRLSTTPIAPSSPCCSSKTTDWRKLGSSRWGKAIRNPGARLISES